MRDEVVLCLAGDVMTGRGVDQILPHPGDPRLWEGYVHDARRYVALAESASGPIDRPVQPEYPWGDALEVLAAADLRVLNLETSVTSYDEPWPAKAVNYRMHPANVGVLTSARPDVLALANNHTLDFGVPGLLETLETLRAAGLRWAGAGRDAAEAWRPAVLEAGGTRVLVWSVGATDSGVPSRWAAGAGTPGVAHLPALSGGEAERLAEEVRRVRRPGDVAVVSIHWGSNWGHEVPRSHRRLAHRLVDAGVDVVHGHSSHHPRPAELYGDGLILYGCGDLVNDYEGIGGHEEHRDDLRLVYLVGIAPGHGVTGLRMMPFRARRMRLDRADPAETAWLAEILTAASRRLGAGVRVAADGSLELRRQ